MTNKEVIKYLGIDWGEKRIGLAQADSETKLALPFKTIDNISTLLKIIQAEDIDLIVLGSPKKMNGDEANNKRWQEFLMYLKKHTDKDIFLLDERLSSLEADALFGNHKVKAGRDEIAAAIILQNYLDHNLSGRT